MIGEPLPKELKSICGYNEFSSNFINGVVKDTINCPVCKPKYCARYDKENLIVTVDFRLKRKMTLDEVAGRIKGSKGIHVKICVLFLCDNINNIVVYQFKQEDDNTYVFHIPKSAELERVKYISFAYEISE